MSECTHDCSSCGENCSEKKEDFKVKQNEYSAIKKVIGIVSGKGGVGKSLATGLFASTANAKGYKTAILDADITGPSVPKMFGVTEKASSADGVHLNPVTAECGVKLMSMNLLLDKDSDPVVWRGPIIAGVVKQFFTDVKWGDVDYMFVDMPPGTGDVPLTVYQSLPLDGIIVVTSPQQLVKTIVEKAVKMAELMNIPVLGIVENMSYFTCPDCGKKINVFGESNVEKVAQEFGIKAVAHIPINPDISKLCDGGQVYKINVPEIEDMFDRIIK